MGVGSGPAVPAPMIEKKQEKKIENRVDYCDNGYNVYGQRCDVGCIYYVIIRNYFLFFYLFFIYLNIFACHFSQRKFSGSTFCQKNCKKKIKGAFSFLSWPPQYFRPSDAHVHSHVLNSVMGGRDSLSGMAKLE